MTSDLVMAGFYNYGLVALSILIAMLGSYATIDLAGRVRASHGGSRLSWRIGGATAMAIGTWAMHFTGMLAFSLPVPIRYDWPTSLLSFLPSLLASAVALVVVLEVGESDVGLLVADDGRGFDPRREFPGHLGLHSMRERAAAVGGTLEIESTPGAGTQLRARIPLSLAEKGPVLP